jgi:hypothetical protein
MNGLLQVLQIVGIFLVLSFLYGVIRGIVRVSSDPKEYLTESQIKGLEILKRRAERNKNNK